MEMYCRPKVVIQRETKLCATGLAWPLTSGFTLIELLVVIGVISILAALLMPVLKRAQAKAQAIVCVNNLKQLTLAWNMYTDDNGDRLAPNNPANMNADAQGNKFPTWARGDMRYGNADGTNVDNIIGQKEGSLGPYIKNAAIFKCPTDRSLTTLADKSYRRVRSYSMNTFVGTERRFGGVDVYAHYIKRCDFGVATRPEIFLFMDVHEDFLTFCTFDLTYDPQSSRNTWHNLPSGRHAGSGVISYVDGHVEIHKWLEKMTLQPVTSTQQLGLLAPASRDFSFVWQRTTRSKWE